MYLQCSAGPADELPAPEPADDPVDEPAQPDDLFAGDLGDFETPDALNESDVTEE